MNADDKVKELFPYANDLARAVGVDYPKNNESPGALWLYTIRDYLDWDDMMELDESAGEEIPWESVETNTYQQWLIFADLELWKYDDADVTYSQTADFPTRNFRTETLRAVKVDDLPGLAESLLGEVANRLWGVIYQELRKQSDDGDAE
jgi:hypothetical protein